MPPLARVRLATSATRNTHTHTHQLPTHTPATYWPLACHCCAHVRMWRAQHWPCTVRCVRASSPHLCDAVSEDSRVQNSHNLASQSLSRSHRRISREPLRRHRARVAVQTRRGRGSEMGVVRGRQEQEGGHNAILAMQQHCCVWLQCRALVGRVVYTP